MAEKKSDIKKKFSEEISKIESKKKETKEIESNYVTQDQLKSFGDDIISKLTHIIKPSQPETHVVTDTIGIGDAIANTELGKDTRGISPVAANDLIPEARLEAFMNEKVMIYVHPSPNKEDNPVIVPSVNGINQPIMRGKKCIVKRKFVEALARNRTTRYEQVIDQLSPDKYEMSPDTVVKDPFSVIQDPNPNGPEWLNRILSEA